MNPLEEFIYTPFLNELIQQIRKQDSREIYKDYSNESLLQLLVLSPRKRENDSGYFYVSSEDRFKKKQLICNFYWTIAAIIERETGQSSETFIKFNPNKQGWVLVFCGRLLVLSNLLRDVQSFGFDSLDKLAVEGEIITQTAIELAQDYFDFPSLTSANLKHQGEVA